MGKTNDSLVIAIEKYGMTSLLVPAAYFIKWLWSKNHQIIDYLPSCLHLYNLSRVVYDRFSFQTKGLNTEKFINNNFVRGDSHYVLTGIDYKYGLSITEMTSVVGLMSSILEYFGTQSGFSYLKSGVGKVGLGKYFGTTNDYSTSSFNITNLNTYSNYGVVATLTLSLLNMLIGSSTASIVINYDVFTEDKEFNITGDPLEVVNYNE